MKKIFLFLITIFVLSVFVGVEKVNALDNESTNKSIEESNKEVAKIESTEQSTGESSLEENENFRDSEAKQSTVESSQVSRADLITNTWGSVTWSFDQSSGILTFTSGGTLGETSSSPWNRTDDKKIEPTLVTSIVFTQEVEAPENSSFLFSKETETDAATYTLSNVTHFEGLDKLSTTNVTSMKGLFYNMNNLEELDVSNFDTSKVTNMNMLFRYCYKVKSLELSNFITDNVTNMAQMFDFMKELVEVDVTSFDTSKVTDMRWMFYKNYQLTQLDLSSFDMQMQPSLRRMFVEDSNLELLILGPGFRSNNFVTDLPDITKEGYTGYWKKLDGPTVGKSSDFLNNFDGSSPGTYIWETIDDSVNFNDENQESLTLNKVPATFDFETPLMHKNYSITQELENERIEIYNDRLSRDWSVMASISNNQLEMGDHSNITFPISSFKINETELVGTGAKGIVFNSVADKSIENNVGTLQVPIHQISVAFQDSEGQIKASTSLKAMVNYQLYNTSNAE